MEIRDLAEGSPCSGFYFEKAAIWSQLGELGRFQSGGESGPQTPHRDVGQERRQEHRGC